MSTYATSFSGTTNGKSFPKTVSYSADSTYENCSIKNRDKATNKTKNVESSKQTNCKKMILGIMVFATFAAFVTCFSLFGKMLSDFNKEKLNSEEQLNKVQSDLMEYINQLNQTIKNQNEIIDNQNMIIQNNTQVVNNYIEIVNNQSEVINDYTKVINNLQNQQSEVDKNLQTLNQMTDNTNENLINGYVILDDDWIAPLNGYQYKLVRSSRSWDEARSYCLSSYGADLASFGVQSIKIRRIIRQEIGYTSYVWIGLNDLTTEGRWRWISSSGSWDGDYATNDISLWYANPPSSYSSSYNCAVMYSSSTYTYPRPCSSNYYFLCEKLYN